MSTLSKSSSPPIYLFHLVDINNPKESFDMGSTLVKYLGNFTPTLVSNMYQRTAQFYYGRYVIRNFIDLLLSTIGFKTKPKQCILTILENYSLSFLLYKYLHLHPVSFPASCFLKVWQWCTVSFSWRCVECFDQR